MQSLVGRRSSPAAAAALCLDAIATLRTAKGSCVKQEGSDPRLWVEFWGIPFFIFLLWSCFWGENSFRMFLNDAPPDCECCKKRVEVSAPAGGFEWHFVQENSHILQPVCLADGLNCILESSVACADIIKRARTHRALVFLDRVCALCAKLCQIPHLTRSQGSTAGLYIDWNRALVVLTCVEI